MTGKFKRGQVPTEGRVGWVAQDEKRATQASPSFLQIKDYEFDIMETVEQIAAKLGLFVFFTLWLFLFCI